MEGENREEMKYMEERRRKGMETKEWKGCAAGQVEEGDRMWMRVEEDVKWNNNKGNAVKKR